MAEPAPPPAALSHDEEMAKTLERPRAAATDVALNVGSAVGRYVVLRRLGEGGMGIVYAEQFL